MKKILALLVCSIAMLIIVACGGTNSASGSTSVSASGTQNTSEVHMNDQQFVQSSVTVSKGSSLALVDDSAVVHVIQNGSWINGVVKPLKENGAPKVDVQLNGNDRQIIGPFTTAGTYHIDCIVHAGMNLTIVVK